MKARYFKLKCDSGFDEELLQLIRQGYEEWRRWTMETLSKWTEDPANGGTPQPMYSFGEPLLSEDGKVLSIEISGDPVSYAGFKSVEDGFPTWIYSHVPKERRLTLLKCYENVEYGYGAWLPVA